MSGLGQLQTIIGSSPAALARGLVALANGVQNTPITCAQHFGASNDPAIHLAA